MSVIWKPSHCPKCNHAIRPYDNVPIFGWLWLKGKCRDCGEPISPRYAIVEFVMGLAFFVLAYAELFSGGANLPGGPITEFTGAVNNFLVPNWPLIGVYAYHCTLLCLLMIIVLVDIDGYRVPLKIVFFGVLLAVICSSNWSYLYPHRDRAAKFGIALSDSHADALLGILASLPGLLVYAFMLISRKKQPFSHVPLNYGVALGLTGIMLGHWAGWLTFLFGGSATAIIVRLNKHRNESSVLRMVSSVWLGTFGIILFWRPIVGLFP